jgi:ring-1,2-phenylacetyl-CoA epoxidase subunit PaaB
MSDTQWPRWEVFKQDRPDKPHQAVGSIHAVDPEHALLTARNVFVRRPQAVSLWVVPADQIFAVSREAWPAHPDGAGPAAAPAVPSQYAIFGKVSQRRAMTFVDYLGQVEAATPQQAWQVAMATFAEPPVLAWWVVPSAAIIRSEPEVVESWFAPAATKTYKQQSAYGLVRAEADDRATE